MPPKTRRKSIIKKFAVVPPTNVEATPIPEWLKLSIQILLINFHPQGVALFNSIRTEYEAVFKNPKINPEDYNFKDWETMLRSSQFKSHFFVYTDKKIPLIKGYPLPRSAVLTMIGNKWEIDPRIEVNLDEKIKVPESPLPEPVGVLCHGHVDEPSRKKFKFIESTIIQSSETPEDHNKKLLEEDLPISICKNENDSSKEHSFDTSDYFRRSDVPLTWTDTEFPYYEEYDEDDEEYDDDEEEEIGEGENFNNVTRRETDLIIEEGSPKHSTAYTATSPETECFSLQQSTLSFRNQISGSEVSPENQKSKGKISDFTDFRGENSKGSFQSSFKHTPSSSKKEQSEIVYFESNCIKVLVKKPNLKCFGELKQCVMPEGSLINLDRDPRLTIGLRATHYLKGDSSNKQVIEKGQKPAEKGEVKTKENAAISDTAGNTNEPIIKPVISEANNTIPIEHNQDFRLIKRDEGPLSPVINTFENGLNFDIKNTIPQDNFDLKSLKFSEMWRSTKWKKRFESDSCSPRKFFKTSIYDRWTDLLTEALKLNREKLLRELQIYEEKRYPANCEYFFRSSLRMVEVDYLTDHQFSDPRTSNGQKLVLPDEILYYVDFAGAPGGVIEFYNKKRKWSSKGFGLTIKEKCYNTCVIPNVVPQFFEPFYGKLNSYKGDGSLFNSDNVFLFVNQIMDATKNRGVHVVSTIGAVAYAAFKDDKDWKWKYQHLAQIMVALLVLREDGNLAFKMYDIKTAFSAGLVYLLYRCFKYVQIIKLKIFCPTSGERAVICLGRKSNEYISEILTFLGECHKVAESWYLKKNIKNPFTIDELVPYSILDEHKEFMDYLRESNERIINDQINELRLCTMNLRNVGSIFTPSLFKSLVVNTIDIWKIGNRPTLLEKNPKHSAAAFKELKVYPEDVCEAVETALNEYNLSTIFASAQQWRFLPVGNKNETRGFYLGFDEMPYFFNTKYKEWVRVQKSKFNLPNRTLVYGEIISVFSRDKKQYKKIFTIIDGMVLAGNDIRNLPYSQRISECQKFTLAATKAFFPNNTGLTVSKAHDFSQLPDFLNKIESTDPTLHTVDDDNSKEMKMLLLPVESVFNINSVSAGKNLWFNPSGIIFMESGNCNKETDFCSSLSSRVYWKWVQEMDLPIAKISAIDCQGANSITILHEEQIRPIGSVSAVQLIDFVNRYFKNSNFF